MKKYSETYNKSEKKRRPEKTAFYISYSLTSSIIAMSA